MLGGSCMVGTMAEDVDLSETDRTEDGLDQLAWRQCPDLQTACELTAQWLEGSRHYQPGYAAAQPAKETGPLSAQLARINRLGLLTTESQPGNPLLQGSGQRAYVTGYCAGTTMAFLSTFLVGTELVSMWYPPNTSGQAQICVSVDEYEEFTHLGRSMDAEYVLEEYALETNEALAAIVSECWELQIFDPVWGRNDRLLPALIRALEAMPAAHD